MVFLMGGARSITPSINLGAELNLNNRVKENVKVYLGLEAGIGFGLSVIGKVNPKSFLSGIAKLSVGFKINDKYNIGVYGGYGKGFAGIEAGYTF
ncbi:hypothetical protein [Streptobacillus notomytis]|uniref:hypothetical protein n=1 Tax=Streptobacillus notomytis TaxID=1712031 RepID=UPI000ADECE95|nr:hypothetical protein [Streptobacillus notomytis]